MSNEFNDNNNYQPENNQPQQDNGPSNFYAQPAQAPKPKKKKWPIVAGIAGAVAVAGAGIGCYFAFFNNPSYDAPEDAVSACMSQLDEQFSAKTLGTTALEKKLDSAGMMKELMEKGQYADMTFTLEDSDMEELAMFSGVSAGFSYANDVKNSSAIFGINASIMGIGGDASIYMDSDMLALTSEEFLSDSYISVNMEDLIELVAESEEMSEDELDYLMSTMQQSSQLSSGLMEYMEYATKQLPDSFDKFVKDWDVEESDTDSIEIGKEDYECLSYEVSISAKAAKKFLEDYCTYLSEYDYENNAYFSMLAQSAEMSGEDMDINETLKEALAELPDSIDEESEDTLDFVLYMAPKGQLLGIDIEAEDDSENMTMELRFGGENPGQEIYFAVDNNSEYSDMSVDFSATTTTEKDIETALVEMNVNMDGEELMTLKVQNDYNTEDDSFECDMTANINADGEELSASITAKGQYDEIVEGKSYTMSLDDITLSIDADALAEELEIPFTSISFSGEISCGVLEDELEKPDGTEFDALNLTEEDADALLEVLKESQTFSYILQAIPEETINEFMDEWVNATL